MSPALANFLFEVVNFLALAGLLGWVLWKPMRSTLAAEQERLKAERGESAKLRDEAKALETQARERHTQLETELAAERSRLLEAAQDEAAELRKAAQARQQQETEALRQRLEMERQAQRLSLVDDAAQIVAASVQRLLIELEGPELEQALVRAVCAELKRGPQGVRGSATVESARPLHPTARAELEGVLGPDFTERPLPSLGAGLRVTTSAGKVEASARMFAQEAARKLQHTLREEKGGEDGSPTTASTH